jgi:glycosyltransferase involved in cell wall biosynthesis
VSSSPLAAIVPPPPKLEKVVVVMPAYNAESTVEITFRDIPPDVVSEVILVDDRSKDRTSEVARGLGITTIVHEENTGYGGNQKTCYREALARGADIVVMLHPDYQYDARMIGAMVTTLRLGICDVVLGSRIRTRREALQSGMPAWKYIANRFLTLTENMVLGQNVGDFHTGMRAYTREVLETAPFEGNSDDFVFDTQFLVQAVHFGFRIGDVPVPSRYFAEASSINFRRSVRYGLGTLGALVKFALQHMGLARFKAFERAPGAKPAETPTA